MRRPVFPNATVSFPRCLSALAAALTLGLAAAGHAFAADAAQTVPATGAVATAVTPDTSIGANADYPSQIGPQGPAPTDASSSRATASPASREARLARNLAIR